MIISIMNSCPSVDVKPKGKKLPMKKSAATSLIPPVNVENRNKYFENHKVKLKGYENEMKEMIKSNEYNIDLLNRFTQYLNSFEVDAYDKCLSEYDFYKGGDTVTVKFFCDDLSKYLCLDIFLICLLNTNHI